MASKDKNSWPRTCWCLSVGLVFECGVREISSRSDGMVPRASRRTHTYTSIVTVVFPDQSKQRSEDIERTFELNLWDSHGSLCLCDDDRSVPRVVPMFEQVSTFVG